jgi:hypothetical protein
MASDGRVRAQLRECPCGSMLVQRVRPQNKPEEEDEQKEAECRQSSTSSVRSGGEHKLARQTKSSGPCIAAAQRLRSCQREGRWVISRHNVSPPRSPKAELDSAASTRSGTPVDVEEKPYKRVHLARAPSPSLSPTSLSSCLRTHARSVLSCNLSSSVRVKSPSRPALTVSPSPPQPTLSASDLGATASSAGVAVIVGGKGRRCYNRLD